MSGPSASIPLLESSRLRLEPLSMVHTAGMFEMWRQAAVQEFSGPAQDESGAQIDLPAQSHQDSDRLIRFWLQAAKDGWGFRWAMVLTEDRGFIGHIGFNSLADCSEIAYHMNPHYWGHGYMTEAAEVVIDWRVSTGAKEIEAFIDPDNAGSIALALRLGLMPTSEFTEGARRYLLPAAVIDAAEVDNDNLKAKPGRI